MTTTGGVSERLRDISDQYAGEVNVAPVSPGRIDDLLRGAIDPQRLIDACAEAWRTAPETARDMLMSGGFGDVLARLRPERSGDATGESTQPALASRAVYEIAGGRVMVRAAGPALDAAVQCSDDVWNFVDAPL